MAANKTKKSKKQKAAKIVEVVQKKVQEKSDDFDLEAMEKMLAKENRDENEDEDESDVDSADEAFIEKEEGDDDESDDDGDEEEDDNESQEGSDENDSESLNENDVTDTIVEGEETCSLDLRNLLATNSHQVNHRLLYKQTSTDEDEEISICVNGLTKANEEYLLQKASEGCSQILEGLWSLETEKTDVGPMATLPKYSTIATPRELPPPQQKAETKWEKFAKERGIAPKEKRSRKVWDEPSQSWSYLTGYQKASSANNSESWPIMEVRKNDDPFEDPWQRARDAKKDRVDKNTMSRMRNAESGGLLDRGTSRRVMKARKEERANGREGGSKDVPSGVPLDMVNGKQRGKDLTKLALVATQRSTASLGKFDKMREGEPERRKTNAGLKKRKFESATDGKVVKTEAKKTMKILEHVISGGGKSKDRAIRRGQYAKGETGHDYDYDDGLGPSTYRKKKGRAGIGKMSKVTKKMSK